MVAGAGVISVPVPQLAVWRPELVLMVTVLVALVPLLRPGVRVRLPALAGLALATGAAATTVPAAPILPLGEHFLVDGPAALVRLVVVTLALVVLLVLRPRDERACCLLALAALGCCLLAQAATLAGLLVAVATTALGGGLAAWYAGDREQRIATSQWLAAAGLGFGILAFAGTLWCGLAGTFELAAVPAALVARPSLPPLALPILLGLAGAGLALALLGEPGRFRPDGGDGAPPPLTAWLTVAPPLAAIPVLQRLLAGAGSAPTLAVAPSLTVALAAVLVVVGFVAAMVQDRLARRLAWAALGQAGLTLLGFAAAQASTSVTAPLALLLAMAPAHLGAMLLAEALDDAGWRPRWREAQLLILTGLLLSLAALPPLAGWRPRVDLFAALQAADLRFGLAVAAGGTLLALVVYLRPLVDLWRAPATAADTESPPFWIPVVPTLLAAALLAVVLARGLGLLDPASLLP